MNFASKMIVLPLLSTIFFTSCLTDSSKEKRVKHISSEKVAKVLLTEGNNEKAAEEYARMGELLLLPEGLQYADKMFDKALSADPNNSRALFYSAVLKPVLKFKGFTRRFLPMLTFGQKMKLKIYEQKIRDLNIPEFMEFAMMLPRGKKRINNIYELQGFLKDELLPELIKSSEMISLLENQKTFNLSINLTRLGFGKNYNYSETYCWIDDEGYQTCEYYNESYSTANLKSEIYKVDSSDVTLVKAGVVTLLNYIRGYTAYKFEGVEEIQEEINSLKNGTVEQKIKIINKYENYLVLNSDNQLSELQSSLSEVLVSLIDLYSSQELLCNKYYRKNNLIKDICITSKQVLNYENQLEYLAGPKFYKMGNINGKDILIKMDVSTILFNPISDLKLLLPKQFDEKGNALDLPDNTLGGLFPDGDFLSKLKLLHIL